MAKALCPTCNGRGSTTCPVCNGSKGRTRPTRDGGVEFTQCANCGGSGKAKCRNCVNGYIDVAPPVQENSTNNHSDPLEGTWSLEGGSWIFTKTASGYSLIEKGALGKVGEGTAVLVGEKVTITFSKRIIGPKICELTLAGNDMSGLQKIFGMNMPLVARRTG